MYQWMYVGDLRMDLSLLLYLTYNYRRLQVLPSSTRQVVKKCRYSLEGWSLHEVLQNKPCPPRQDKWLIVFFLISTSTYSQTHQAGETYIYEFRDGTTIIGKFIKEEMGNIYINDLAGEELYLPKVMVAQIHEATDDNIFYMHSHCCFILQ